LVRFVLIHGGYHGAWCWDRLTPELEKFGHSTVAIDLPGCNHRHAETASLASWRSALREVIQDGDVLVGHSMGGFAIALAADEVPDKVGRLIFLSAAVPIEGEAMGASTADSVANEWPTTVGLAYEEFLEVVEIPNQGPCVRLTKQMAANKLFYHDCSPDDQDWAWERLTPLPLAPALESFHVPRFWDTPIPRDFILTTDDYSHSKEMDNIFMRRLGLSTAFSIISSHSPFVSQPSNTAKLLDACAGGALSS
jgi:pimeloyl-ACP methyl ester carboxylesterase